jgi:hypothetical protein
MLNQRTFISSMKLLRRSWLFVLSITVLILLFAVKISTVHAENINISSAKNCDSNAVMYCGANSVTDLTNKYDNGDGVNSAASIQAIYSYFGISSSDIQSMASSAVDVEAGSVTSAGNVYGQDGKLVATNAITGGRQDIAGSTMVEIDGKPFYTRPPSISFVSSPLDAFVVMSNGRFDFAILASCGNAVKATPVTSPTPTTKPTPPTKPVPATPTPTSNICSGTTVNVNNGGTASQGGNCSTNTTVVQNNNTITSPPPTSPTPASTPAPATTSAAVTTTPAPQATAPATSLVNTGPGNVVAVFFGATVVGTFSYRYYLRKTLSSKL